MKTIDTKSIIIGMLLTVIIGLIFQKAEQATTFDSIEVSEIIMPEKGVIRIGNESQAGYAKLTATKFELKSNEDSVSTGIAPRGLFLKDKRSEISTAIYHELKSGPKFVMFEGGAIEIRGDSGKATFDGNKIRFFTETNGSAGRVQSSTLGLDENNNQTLTIETGFGGMWYSRLGVELLRIHDKDEGQFLLNNSYLQFYSKDANKIAYLGQSRNKYGLMTLYNKDGEFGWGVSGE